MYVYIVATSERLSSSEVVRRSQSARVGVVKMASSSEEGSSNLGILRIAQNQVSFEEKWYEIVSGFPKLLRMKMCTGYLVISRRSQNLKGVQ